MDWGGPRAFNNSCATVPLANWMHREDKDGWDKRVRITTKKKRSSSRERARPELAIGCDKGWGASPGEKKERVGKLVEREMRRIESKLL